MLPKDIIYKTDLIWLGLIAYSSENPLVSFFDLIVNDYSMNGLGEKGST